MPETNLLSLAFLQRRPKAAAELLQTFPPEQTAEFLNPLAYADVVPVVAEMAKWPAARTLSLMREARAARILVGIPAAEAETLLRLMTVDRRDDVLRHMPSATAKRFTQKLNYPLSTVGAWMDTSIPYFTADSTVNDCQDFLKRQKIALGGILIVVDDRRQLLGVVEVEMLLTRNGEAQLSELLTAEIAPLPARATLWEVEEHEGWETLPTLPVVDRHNLLLGALTHSALRAGTAKARESMVNGNGYSLISHMVRAMFVTLGGLLRVISGVR